MRSERQKIKYCLDFEGTINLRIHLLTFIQNRGFVFNQREISHWNLFVSNWDEFNLSPQPNLYNDYMYLIYWYLRELIHFV